MAQHTDFSVAAIGWLATDYPFHRHLQGAVYLEPNVSKSDLQLRLAKHYLSSPWVLRRRAW